ncbi:MAG: hypothetical protein WD579_01580 [Candidatus Paceibacterota bacterium]
MKLTAIEVLFRHALENKNITFNDMDAEERIVQLLKEREVQDEDILSACTQTQNEEFQQILLVVIMRMHIAKKREVEILLRLFPHCLSKRQRGYLLSITIGTSERSLSVEEFLDAYRRGNHVMIQERVILMLKGRMKGVKEIAGIS